MPTSSESITSLPGGLAAVRQPSRRLANGLAEEPPGMALEREAARRALPYVLGLLGLFAVAIVLIRVLRPASVEHLTILFGLCSAVPAVLAMWILHDGTDR